MGAANVGAHTLMPHHCGHAGGGQQSHPGTSVHHDKQVGSTGTEPLVATTSDTTSMADRDEQTASASDKAQAATGPLDLMVGGMKMAGAVRQAAKAHLPPQSGLRTPNARSQKRKE
jgi:hypothetical protein